MKEGLFFSTACNIFQIIDHLFHKSQKDCKVRRNLYLWIIEIECALYVWINQLVRIKYHSSVTYSSKKFSSTEKYVQMQMTGFYAMVQLIFHNVQDVTHT